MARFEGKAIIVTGGAKGIGAATVLRFVDEGAHVLLADVDDGTGVALAESLGDKAVYVHADATIEADVAAMVEAAVARFGGVDILVNNAGATTGKALADMTEAEWQWELDVNLKSFYLCTRLALPRLLERCPGASIVNVSSVNGMMAIAQDGYSAAKAGVTSLTRTIAATYGPRGLRCNVVSPGTVRTTIGGGPRDEGYWERVGALYPLRRVAEPGEIASAIAFLASDDASFISGANLPADGALTSGTDIFGRLAKGARIVEEG